MYDDSSVTFLFNMQETKDETLGDRVWPSCAWGVRKHCKFIFALPAMSVFLIPNRFFSHDNKRFIGKQFCSARFFCGLNVVSNFKMWRRHYKFPFSAWLLFCLNVMVIWIWISCRLDMLIYPTFLCWYLQKNGRGMLVFMFWTFPASSYHMKQFMIGFILELTLSCC